jgi:hypothetical protein
MKQENVYTQWKAYRRQVVVPDHFTTDVMQRIGSVEIERNDEFPAGLLDLPGCLVRWSAAGGLILVGLFRLFFIVANLLQPHLLMP